MAGARLFRQDDFTGGLNLRADQFQLAPNESPRMLNVEIDPRGGIFSRGAMRAVNGTAVTPNWVPERLFPFYGSSNYLMLSTGFKDAVNGDVFYSPGESFGSFASLSIPVSDEHGANFSPWGSKLYISTGVNTASRVWDGTTVVSLAEPGWAPSYISPVSGTFPKASLTATHAGKIFVANTKEGSTAYPNRIRWSHPNNPESWAELDRIDINDGGSEITAIVPYSGHLVIFKRNAVFALFGYDSDTFQVVEISRTVGAATSHSVVATERGVYFFSYPDGLMLYNGERVIDLFEQMRPAIQNGWINNNAIEEVYVNYINRRVWVSVPYNDPQESYTVATTPTMALVYDPSISARGSWLMFRTADLKAGSGGCTFIKKDGTTLHLLLHATLPYVLSVDLYNTSYDNINGLDYQFESRYRTRWYDAGTYSQKKMFRRPDIITKQNPQATQIGVKAYADYEEASGSEMKQYILDLPASGSGMIWGISEWNAANWGAANTGSQITTGRSIGLAKSIQLEFSGPVGKPWGINSFSLKYNPRKVIA